VKLRAIWMRNHPPSVYSQHVVFVVGFDLIQFGGKIEYYAPPLTDEDFNKPVGKFSQTIFLRNCSRALTATSIGNMIVWDANKFVTLGVYGLHELAWK